MLIFQFQHLENFNFVQLSSLHLHHCYWACKRDRSDPFKGCLNLKNLQIVNCNFLYLNLEISAPQRTNLTVSSTTIEDFSSDPRLVISTPKLTSFDFQGSVYYDVSIVYLPFLEKVNIDIDYWLDRLENSYSESKQRSIMLCLCNMLQGIGNAKYVRLSQGFFKVLAMLPDLLDGQPSPFARLNILKIKLSYIRRLSFTIAVKIMTYLLSGSPSPEAIVIEYP